MNYTAPACTHPKQTKNHNTNILKIDRNGKTLPPDIFCKSFDSYPPKVLFILLYIPKIQIIYYPYLDG